MRLLLLCLTILAAGAASPALAQEPANPAHDELRALRDDMVDAVNKADLDRLLNHLAPNVVVTFQNAEVARGREGVRAYYLKMTKGPGALVQTYSTAVTVDDLTVLYGDDTGVAFGGSHDNFKLSSGAELVVDGRWTATLVRTEGRWMVASFHASVNMFDNPILYKMKNTAYITALFGFVMGIIIGAGVASILKRRRPAA
jgi:uncharacterized protein (TIGR02246 family)